MPIYMVNSTVLPRSSRGPVLPSPAVGKGLGSPPAVGDKGGGEEDIFSSPMIPCEVLPALPFSCLQGQLAHVPVNRVISVVVLR